MGGGELNSCVTFLVPGHGGQLEARWRLLEETAEEKQRFQPCVKRPESDREIPCVEELWVSS